jgi:tRNA (cmo5U34)-methyltransferase
MDATVERFQVPEEWTFKSEHVAKHFDAHVREQLPWYELATGIVAHVARQYLPERGCVVDVGASTGNIGRALADTIKARHVEFIPIDSAPQMQAVYDGPGELRTIDVVDFDFADEQPDLVVAFLALMFVPIPLRRNLVERIKGSLRPGGAFVVFDKMEPRPGYLGVVTYRLTLAAKHEQGATAEDVIAKELSLAGLQRPMNEGELEGFVEVFRFGDFTGWVYEKR